MEQSTQTLPMAATLPPKADITLEPYKGPSATIASLGYGFVDFKLATIASLFAGVVSAFFVPRQANKTLAMISEETKLLSKSPNLIKKTAGLAMQQWNNAGDWFVEHFPFRNIISNGVSNKYFAFKGLGDEGWKSGSKIAGMIMTPLFFITGFTGIARGVQSANMGRSQFERAKHEIKDLRVENDALRKKNAEIIAQDAAEDNAQNAAKNSPNMTGAPVENGPAAMHTNPEEQGTKILASDTSKKTAEVPSSVIAANDAVLADKAHKVAPDAQMAVS